MSAPGSTEPELVHERRGHVLVLRLNRPAARNAVTRSLLTALGAGLVEAERDPEVRVIVLTATGDRAFCSGMDLRSFSAGESMTGDDEAYAASKRLYAGDTTIPIVGAANGTAIGGGLELLLGADVIVASDQAKFGFPEVKRGLFAAGGGTFLGTRIPMALALELLLTGDLVDAARAKEIGLVNQVVPAADVLDTALALAERIAANAPLSLAATKDLVRLAISDHAAAREKAAEYSRSVFSSADAKEGAAAFMEKRPPEWQGR